MRRFGGTTMGTSWSVLAVDPPAGIARVIVETLDLVVDQMSHWLPSSQLGRFNAAPVGKWHRIGTAFAEVMAAALDIAAHSDGAFDPAIGTAVDLWGFGPPGPRADADAPGEREIAAARAAAGHDAIELDPLLLRLRRTRAARLDLSGIAKGYAVDAVAARLRTLGCADFLAEIGGELVGAGIQPDGQPWWVDVETPAGVTLPPMRIALHGLAIATSGDYRRTSARGSHMIDPRTVRPIANGVMSVSVLDTSCMRADAWASALAVLGPERGMAVADRHGLAAHMLTRTPGGSVGEHLSGAIRAMLEDGNGERSVG